MNTIDTLSALILGSVATIVGGPYMGAIVIAFVASFTRTAFENSCEISHRQCFKKLLRYFFMALGMSTLLVSVSAWMELNQHASVVVGGLFACFAEESIGFIKTNHSMLIKKIIMVISNDKQ